MPLAAHNPTDRVEQLIILTDRLTALIKQETVLLQEHRAQEITAFQDERAKLSTLYAQEMALIKENKALIEGVESKLSAQLKDKTATFQNALDNHASILKRVQSVTEGMIKAVAEDLAEKNTSQTHYGNDGALRTHQDTKAASLSVHQVV